MALVRRARADVSRSAATACEAAGTQHYFNYGPRIARPKIRAIMVVHIRNGTTANRKTYGRTLFHEIATPQSPDIHTTPAPERQEKRSTDSRGPRSPVSGIRRKATGKSQIGRKRRPWRLPLSSSVSDVTVCHILRPTSPARSRLPPNVPVQRRRAAACALALYG
jgi:hypothetical protein